MNNSDIHFCWIASQKYYQLDQLVFKKYFDIRFYKQLLIILNELYFVGES